MLSKKPLVPCPTCFQAKSHALPHPPSPSQSCHPFQLLFLDVWGPTPILSSNGSRFYLLIVDDFSKFILFFPLTAKSKVSTVFLAFITYVKNTFASNIIAIQTDWDGEFHSLSSLIKNLGITHRISCPSSHQQNGTVKR